MFPNSPEEKRSGLALGYALSIRVSAIAIEMVLPCVVGVWLDEKLGTFLLFTVLGAILGMTTAILSLMRLATNQPFSEKNQERPPDAQAPETREPRSPNASHSAKKEQGPPR
jgi:F0F1-type ATP synthase assembly protein I